MISFSKAKSLATEWLHSQHNVPAYAHLAVGAYDSESGGRPTTLMVAVRFEATREIKDFALVRLIVTDEEQVEIRRDRRERVEQILAPSVHEFVRRPARNGYDNPDAFLAFSEAIDKRGDAPDWFEDILLESEDASERGYDCWVCITTLAHKSVRIPVKIFASKSEKARYCRKKSTIHVQRMIALVVAEAHSPEYTRSQFYHLLRQMREHRVHG
ncbi:MAG TPA: hypothetical protein VN495_02595 [Candidatus Paceibacterota bacterium]|nr:hypothetical protein [Candidatus Paceibacterota bacterium]